MDECITYVGLDVHKETISVALADGSRRGEVSFVTPFRYSRLLFALVIAVAVFGERPDALTLLGAGAIIASGLYTLLRERRLRRRF